MVSTSNNNSKLYTDSRNSPKTFVSTNNNNSNLYTNSLNPQKTFVSPSNNNSKTHAYVSDGNYNSITNVYDPSGNDFYSYGKEENQSGDTNNFLLKKNYPSGKGNYASIKEDKKLINVNNNHQSAYLNDPYFQDCILISENDPKNVYIILIIQFIIIISLFWLGCYYGINETFIKSKSSMLWTFIVSLFFSCSFSFFSFYSYYNLIFSDCPLVLAFFSCLLYIPLTIFYCFLLTAFTKYEYILEVLYLILINCIIIETNHCLSETLYIVLIMLLQLATDTVVLFIYYYFLIKKKKNNY